MLEVCHGAVLIAVDFYQIVIIRIILVIPASIFKFDIPWDHVNEGFKFFSNTVLQVPFLLMTIMSHITPTLDDLYVYQRDTLEICC